MRNHAVGVDESEGQFGNNEPQNPSTRRQAGRVITAILQDHVARGIVTLIGFDFSYGHVASFAAVLGPTHKDQAQGAAENKPWRETPNLTPSKIKDDAANRSNRWEVAAELNLWFHVSYFRFEVSRQ